MACYRQNFTVYLYKQTLTLPSTVVPLSNAGCPYAVENKYMRKSVGRTLKETRAVLVQPPHKMAASVIQGLCKGILH